MNSKSIFIIVNFYFCINPSYNTPVNRQWKILIRFDTNYYSSSSRVPPGGAFGPPARFAIII